MSSIAYFAEIIPDPFLRRIVLWSGVLLCIVAILVILNLPMDLWARLALSVGWAALSVRELRQLRAGWAECRRLRISPDREIAVLQASDEWCEAQWVTGGVLLQKIGWIRVRNRHGVVFGELLCGDVRASPDWRRLQVIWRHVGA